MLGRGFDNDLSLKQTAVQRAWIAPAFGEHGHTATQTCIQPTGMCERQGPRLGEC